MRFVTRAFAFVALFVLAVSASPLESIEPEVVIEVSFPEHNPFGHIVNGERNQIYLLVENKSDQNVTLKSVGGSFHHPDNGALVKNTTSLTYDSLLLEKSKVQIPYAFYSEFKPGDLRLNIWLEHSVDDLKFRVTAFDSVVTIVEPEGSWFDLKLISTYLIVAAFLGGASYFIYLTYFPAARAKKSKRVRPNPSAPASTVTVTSSGARYEEEWIPEHHLKKPTARKPTAVSSGEEVSGGETSGTERKRRKGKK
ncbi:hypothetical protein J3R82DRAFT_11469 [Butyriboletus roseoflavus]|nr:hypothetical protein J3R82DRAFT_11469 [Butyriboletus roseoflavus]